VCIIIRYYLLYNYISALSSSLANLLQGKTQEDLEHFKNLDTSYEPQFFRFIKDNITKLHDINLSEIQSNWEEISRYVDIKSPENIQRYMETREEKNENEFDTYMKYHGVSASKIKKYEQIYKNITISVGDSAPYKLK